MIGKVYAVRIGASETFIARGAAATADELTRDNAAFGAMSLRAATINETDRTVDAVISTAIPVPTWDYRRGEVIDEVLDPDGAAWRGDQVPLLNSHMRYTAEDVIGSVRALRKENGEVVGRLHFADIGSDVTDRIWRLAAGGHITDVSVGAARGESEIIERGASKVIRGKQYTAKDRPLRVTSTYTIREVSMVPIGADPNATLRQDDAGNNQTEKDHKMKLKQDTINFLRRLGLPEDADDAAARAFFDGLTGRDRMIARGIQDGDIKGDEADALRGAAAPTPEPAPGEPAAGPQDEFSKRLAEAKEEIRRDEAARRKAIRDMSEGIDRALVDEMLESAKTVDQVRAVFLEHLQTRRPAGLNVINHDPERHLTIDAMGDALALRAGIKIDDERANRAEPFTDYPIMRIAEKCIERETGRPAPHRRDELIARALGLHSLPQLLGNVANKSLAMGFEETPSSALMWVGQTQVKDFKANRHIRTSAANDLRKIGRGAPFPEGEITETYEDYRIETYAERISFSREDMIDDDLRALTETPAKLGAAGRRLLDDLVYTVLLANGTMNEKSAALFSASVAGFADNYFDGASSALASSSLTTAVQLMMKQTGMKGEAINILPKYLIVPPELAHTAKELINASQIQISGTAKQPTINVHQGTLQPVIEPRLSNSNYSGYSATAWYLAADYRQAEHILLAYLSGSPVPTIERKDPADQLGIGWWVFYDLGAKAVGFRGMTKSKGAA